MSAIEETRHGEWRRHRLNRPDRLNSLNDDLKDALLSHLAEAARDPACRAVLLTGTGRGFRAGEDLAARGNRLDAPAFGRALAGFLQSLRTGHQGDGKAHCVRCERRRRGCWCELGARLRYHRRARSLQIEPYPALLK